MENGTFADDDLFMMIYGDLCSFMLIYVDLIIKNEMVMFHHYVE